MNNNKTNQSKPKPKVNTHTNFIEALKSHGTAVAKDLKKGVQHDLFGDMPQNFADNLFGTNHKNSGASNPQMNQGMEQPPFDFSEYINSGENFAKQRQHDQAKRMYERSETVVFNRRNDEIKKKIEAIQAELKKLAKAVINLDETANTVIEQEVVDPGVYHLNFFDHMLIFIRRLRKQTNESRHWANLSNQRKGHKSYYWKQANSKIGGTKFMLSGERAVQTQTG